MNNMAYREMRTIKNWLAVVLSRRFRQLWLVILCALTSPGYVYAASCTDWSGSGANINLQLPSSVSFAPGVDFPPYTSPPDTIKYKCSAPGSHSVAVVRLGDIAPLTNALKAAGLKLEILITDSGKESTWDFSVSPPAESVNIGVPYTDETGDRTMTVRTKLSRNTSAPAPNPGFYAVPSLTAFKLKPFYNSGSGPFLITPSVRFQYVPTCFVKTSLNTNNVSFGPVITTDVSDSFSRSLPFTVRAGVNSGCNGGNFGNLQKDYTVSLSGGSKTFYLDLPLKVSFMLNNGGELSSDNKSIILHNPEGNNNGLQLRITDNNNIPVTFGETSSPDNKFGNFQGGPGGGTWNISNTYNAVLFPTGDPVKTGKYSAQVTVKVEYY
ncbi:fimbrial protein [Salmonella enterica]|uniref:fimbrial protein n=1 Tax=Salmonella enterica TaxID=28901 RepID=UPI003D31DF15